MKLPRRTGCLIGAGVLVVGLYLLPAFLLPGWLYLPLYGWRYPSVFKVGDVAMTDNGPAEASSRYVATLARVDLTHVSSYTITLLGLPSDRFILGLDIASSKPQSAPLDEAHPIHAEIAVTVVDEKDEVVISERQPLAKWVWSGWAGDKGSSFVYLRGESRDVPISAGSVRVESIGVKADGGWGTYFQPRRSATYRITIEVAVPDADAAPYLATLVLKGGGWK